MKISDVVIPENMNVSVDPSKNRLEIHLDGGHYIIAYYPAENLQVYVYNIDSSEVPDRGEPRLRTKVHGRYLRTLICRKGHGDFVDNGIEMNLSGGEFSVKYGLRDDGNFRYSANCLIGVETVLQVDYEVEESVLLKLLTKALRDLGLSEDDLQKEQWYFSGYSQESEKSIDRLIENAVNGADSALILINATEVGYNLGSDYRGSSYIERKYTTNSQRAIAADIYRHLTEKYGERLTAAVFAEKYGLSDTTVKNYFKHVYGYSFKEYQMKVRMEKAAELLESTDMKMVAISTVVGYATQAKFIDAFKKYYRMTPSEYRRMKKIGKILNP